MPENISSDTEQTTLEPYQSKGEFLLDLQKAISDGYGVYLEGGELEEAGRNVDQFLKVFL